MAKRKRGGPRSSAQDAASEYEPKTRLTINSHEDVADSEDEFHINRDKILLDGELGSKKRKLEQQENDFLEASDEEVLAYNNVSEDDTDADDFDDDLDEQVDQDDDSVSEVSRNASEDEDDNANWGPEKSAYYNADKLETEQDYLDEETEARRLQRKRLKALQDANIDFDEDAWRDEGKAEEANEGEGGVITEVLPQLQIKPGMTESEKEKLLYKRYPEFEYLAEDFLDMKAVHEKLSAMIHEQSTSAKGIQPVLKMKHQAASAYLGALSMYFALLSSTASNDIENAEARPLPAHELRDHDIMDTLVLTRDLWGKIQDVPIPAPASPIIEKEAPSLANGHKQNPVPEINRKPNSQPLQAEESIDPKILASRARRAARAKEADEANKVFNAKLASILKRNSNAAMTEPTTNAYESDSSIGDEAPLSAEAAAEKARKRKSLRFYTSQIAQKANRRERAGQGAAGGDEDLPYRERWRDKVERLNREAEKRGKKQAAEEEALGDDDEGLTNIERELADPVEEGEEDELTAKVRAKKASRYARDAAHRAAQAENAQVVPYEKEEVGPDGRRQIGYTIQKNKGLTAKRKKEVKNPRVKKRRRFEDKSKKLKSMKPTYKGGEGKGGYGGELTGIKSGLVRSTKL
ncbi:MAG: hypothetical protein M1828_006438 [Chrysothrix sp. TS-e1954]|nr:MAG: hypothetical protein M1828_006438 [Chrysothrix sp. TS-e1954]